jgi:C-terminal peptidase prc
MISFLSKPIALNKKGYFYYPERYFSDDAARLNALKKKVTSDVARRIALGETEADVRKSEGLLYQQLIDELTTRWKNDTAVLQRILDALVQDLDSRMEYLMPATLPSIQLPLPPSKQKETEVKQYKGRIGAVLLEVHEKVLIERVVSGLPADQAGLQNNDELLAVAEENGSFYPLTGKDIAYAISIISGRPNTKLYLKVRRTTSQGSFYFIVDLVRTEAPHSLEHVQYRIKQIKTSNGSQAIALVSIPQFHFEGHRSFGKYGKLTGTLTSTALEIERVINALHEQNIAGIILDLRNNFGRTMQQINAIAGLFLSKGAFFQYQHYSASLQGFPTQIILPADTLNTQPLVVMIDQANKGPAEALSATLQDYKRAVLVGYPTFGMGDFTIISALGDGELLMAGYEGFRVTGKAIKNGGIQPDVLFEFDHCNVGHFVTKHSERKPPKNIAPVPFTPLQSEQNTEVLTQKHQARLRTNTTYQTLNESIESAGNKPHTGFPLSVSQWKTKAYYQPVSLKPCRDLEESEAILVMIDMLSFSQ